MIRFMDAHCHLEDSAFDDDRDEAIRRLKDRGIVGCVDCGSDLATSLKALELARKEPAVFAACGIHPHEAAKATDEDLQKIYDLLHEDRVVALGEIGLDYYYDNAWRDIQKAVLREQIRVAVRMDIPVVFHIRDAHGDMLDILRSEASLPGGVVHCFSGSAETAMDYVRLGFYISFAGPLTYKKAPQLERACLQVPENRLLVETDSPYLAPVPMRGKRNEPANTFYVLEKMAALRGRPVEEMAEITLKNTMNVYRIPENSFGYL